MSKITAMKSLFIFLIVKTVIVFENLAAAPEEKCDYEHDSRTYVCKNIEGVFPNVFYGNYHLQCIDCDLRTFTNQTFPFANNLLSFNVSASRIRSINEEAFSSLSNVQYIYLQNNGLVKIAPYAFRGLRQVYELHLEKNHLGEILPGFLADLEVNTVELRDNKLQVLPNDGFEGSLGILILDVSVNSIKNINENAFVGLENLEVLNLEKNRICHLPLGLFKHLASLRQLNLADNKLSKFQVGTFSGLRNVNSLNLANNSISAFDGNILIPFAHLSRLDISRNGIYYFDANSVRLNVPTLRTLRLDDNLLSCGHLSSIIQYFRGINVDVVNTVARYSVQNVIGIACTEMIITSEAEFDQFLKVVEGDTKKSLPYC